MSQKIRATWVSDRHGMIWKVEGSGRATMSASWIRANPAMAEPSSPRPSASALGSSWVVMAIDFRNPSTSVNHSRMNLIPRSSTVRSTYSASFDRFMRTRPSSLGEESVERAEPETVTGVLNQLGQDSGHRPGEDRPHRVGLEPAKDDEGRHGEKRRERVDDDRPPELRGHCGHETQGGCGGPPQEDPGRRGVLDPRQPAV